MTLNFLYNEGEGRSSEQAGRGRPPEFNILLAVIRLCWPGPQERRIQHTNSSAGTNNCFASRQLAAGGHERLHIIREPLVPGAVCIPGGGGNRVTVRPGQPLQPADQSVGVTGPRPGQPLISTPATEYRGTARRGSGKLERTALSLLTVVCRLQAGLFNLNIPIPVPPSMITNNMHCWLLH